MKPRLEDIQHFVAEHFGLSMGDMQSPERSRRVARPRQVAMYLSREITTRSLPEIGRRFGGRDHTTVLHAHKRIIALMADDPQFADEIATLRRRIDVTRPTGFNVLSLGEWLAVARSVRVPHVPAKWIAEVDVDDLRFFDTTDDVPREARLRAFFRATYQAKKPGHVLRWDHCASGELKAEMARGGVRHAPPIKFTIDDPRAYDLLDDLPPSQTKMTAWLRPWVPARFVGEFPVEYRVFIEHGQIIAVSSYYPQRPLEMTDLVRYEIKLACVYAEALVRATPTPILNSQVEAAGLNPAEISCTLDFIATERGVLFLEGGPPHTAIWGAHPCCFGERPVSGIALSDRAPVIPETFGRHLRGLTPAELATAQGFDMGSPAL